MQSPDELFIIFLPNIKTAEEFIFKPVAVKNSDLTPKSQIGVEDIFLPLKDQNSFDSLWNQTELEVTKTTQGYNRRFFKAKSAVVLPFSVWQKTLNQT